MSKTKQINVSEDEILTAASTAPVDYTVRMEPMVELNPAAKTTIGSMHIPAGKNANVEPSASIDFPVYMGPGSQLHGRFAAGATVTSVYTDGSRAAEEKICRVVTATELSTITVSKPGVTIQFLVDVPQVIDIIAAEGAHAVEAMGDSAASAPADLG